MDRIARAVTDAFPSLVCLGLIGAFGRGEGAVVFSEQGLEPWNDYDLLLVTPTRDGWDQLPTLAKTLASELGTRGIDIVPFLPDELEKKADAMLVVDARAGHVVIAGDTSLPSRIPHRSVPDSEALILLLNRMVCLLEAPPPNLTVAPSPPLFFTSQLCKAVYAVVDARLVRAGQYVTSYREKTARFLSLPGIASGLKEIAEEALSFRLNPCPRDWCASWWFLVRDEMLAEIGLFLGAKSGTSPHAMARRLWARRYEGWRALLRLLVQRRRPNTTCRAVQCGELLTLAAASEHGPSNDLLLGEAVKFLAKAETVGSSIRWEEVARRAVRLWFAVCHG
jgi:hypothetical protein